MVEIAFLSAVISGCFLFGTVTAWPDFGPSGNSWPQRPVHPGYPARPVQPYPSGPSYPNHNHPSSYPTHPGPNGRPDSVFNPATLSLRERECYNVLMALGNKNITAFDAYNPTVFIQHNPMFPSSKEAIVNMVRNSTGNFSMTIVRMFQDGDYVFVHTGVPLKGSAGFDVYRYDEQGFIGEHWDNFQAQPNVTNPSNRTMLDGPAQAVDLDRTEANKALVSAYAFSQVNGRLRTDLLAESLIQHQPNIGDGVGALTKGLADLVVQGKDLKYKGIFKVIGEGNFVLVMAPGTQLQGAVPVGIFDLYRVQDGKIAEQWSTVSTIPPPDKWANQNGKFNGFDSQI